MAENKVTDYGEEYNRESMYETAREILIDGKKVKMNGKCHDSLIGIMIEDYAMEMENESKYLAESDQYLKAKDDDGFITSFSKTMSRSKVTSMLQERLDIAIKNVKNIQELNQYINENMIAKKETSKMSVEELNYALDLLKEYESSLLFRLNGDCITKATYKTYIITQKYIKEIEDELAKRHANINL